MNAQPSDSDEMPKLEEPPVNEPAEQLNESDDDSDDQLEIVDVDEAELLQSVNEIQQEFDNLSENDTSSDGEGDTFGDDLDAAEAAAVPVANVARRPRVRILSRPDPEHPWRPGFREYHHGNEHGIVGMLKTFL